MMGESMQDYTTLIGIFAALAVGVVSPGPSFLLVARTAVSSSRNAGLLTAVGMGVGGVVFAAAALLGLHAVLLAVPSLYLGLKVFGGLYLTYIGIKIWFAADRPLSDSVNASSERTSPSRSFAMGFATQVSNPKTAIVYASVFAAFMPPVTTFSFNGLPTVFEKWTFYLLFYLQWVRGIA